MWLRSLILATTVTLSYTTYQFLATPSPFFFLQPIKTSALFLNSQIPPIFKEEAPNTLENGSSQNFKSWLYRPDLALNPQAVSSIETILNYTDANQIEHNHILTLIDYSLPANEKRLWVFDLNAHKILFHTYVSHGLKSGSLESHYFSNRFDSKASSIGVYRTNKTYYGRHGLSLKLDGLDRGFNDNADSRAIVMHGGWYVEEAFIQKYGRAGRSWGCPAVPDQLTSDIINTIKEKSLFVVYYPSAEWFEKSRFLKTEDNLNKPNQQPAVSVNLEPEKREEVLMAQILKKQKYQETEAILAMPVNKYRATFQTTIPLERMIRRQIENQEYIALSKTEFDALLNTYPKNNTALQNLEFILPEIKMTRGYYATEMRTLHFGSITDVETRNISPPRAGNTYTIQFAHHPALALKPTNRFIRWLGL